jgi:DNA repair protein RecO (recombination protein O)
MNERLVTAIILGMVDVKEADRVVTLFSREEGRLAAYARSVRKSIRRFGGDVAPFSVVRAHLKGKGDSMPALLSVDGIGPRRRPDATSDVPVFAMRSLVSELVDMCACDGVPEVALFDRLLCTAERTAGVVSEEALVEETFDVLWDLIETLGYMPDLARCSCCGGSVSEGEDRYTVTTEGLRCGRCAGRLVGGFSGSTIVRMRERTGRGCSGDGKERESARGSSLEDVGHLLDMIESVIGRRVRSRSFFFAMLEPTERR